MRKLIDRSSSIWPGGLWRFGAFASIIVYLDPCDVAIGTVDETRWWESMRIPESSNQQTPSSQNWRIQTIPSSSSDPPAVDFSFPETAQFINIINHQQSPPEWMRKISSLRQGIQGRFDDSSKSMQRIYGFRWASDLWGIFFSFAILVALVLLATRLSCLACISCRHEAGLKDLKNEGCAKYISGSFMAGFGETFRHILIIQTFTRVVTRVLIVRHLSPGFMMNAPWSFVDFSISQHHCQLVVFYRIW